MNGKNTVEGPLKEKSSTENVQCGIYYGMKNKKLVRKTITSKKNTEKEREREQNREMGGGGCLRRGGMGMGKGRGESFLFS